MHGGTFGDLGLLPGRKRQYSENKRSLFGRFTLRDIQRHSAGGHFPVNPFRRFLPNKKRTNNNYKSDSGNNYRRTEKSFEDSLTNDDNFSNIYIGTFRDPFYSSAWVNIAINILIRNIAR